MASEWEFLNLPPVLSASHIIQPTNEDTALSILLSVLKTGTHLPADKWTTLVKLLLASTRAANRMDVEVQCERLINRLEWKEKEELEACPNHN